MGDSLHSGGSSISIGGFMMKCGCGVPSKIRTVTKRNHNRGRKFRGCGKFPEVDCGFFKWLYDDVGGCVECEMMSKRLNAIEKEVESLTMKLNKVKAKKSQFHEQISDLKSKLCQSNLEKNKHIAYTIATLFAMVISWAMFVVKFY